MSNGVVLAMTLQLAGEELLPFGANGTAAVRGAIEEYLTAAIGTLLFSHRYVTCLACSSVMPFICLGTHRKYPQAYIS